MKPRTRHIAHTSALTHDSRSSRARYRTRRSRPESCCAREEDDAVGRAGDLVEGAAQLGLAAATCAHPRHARPHPLVELVAELVHEALGVLGDIEIAFRDQLFAMPRTHAQELHRWRLW